MLLSCGFGVLRLAGITTIKREKMATFSNTPTHEDFVRLAADLRREAREHNARARIATEIAVLAETLDEGLLHGCGGVSCGSCRAYNEDALPSCLFLHLREVFRGYISSEGGCVNE